jgi:hypothetical protein
MRIQRFRLVLLLAALAPPLLGDPPAPIPTANGAAGGTARAASAEAAPTPTPTPVPTLPATITLSNGTVLHNVSAIRWMKESVTLKHTGGADTVYYAYIAEPDRTTVLAVRDDALKKKKAEKPDPSAVRGLILVSTPDSGDIPLANVKVYAIKIEAINRFATEGALVSLPKALATATTGADGAFSLTVPPGEDYFIYAKSAKFMGQAWEHYEWRLPISQVADRQNVQLTSASNVPLGDQKGVAFEP